MAGNGGGQHLLVFAKAPVAGEVKTRLRPLLKAEQSARFHERLVQHCLQTLTRTEQWQLELWAGSPYDCWGQLCEKYGCKLFFQQGEGLGERLLWALTESLSRADKVVVIGTDCPELTTQIIAKAFTALDDHDVVLGPAEDGGYVLLGMNRLYAPLFQNIDWGSDQVLAQTLRRIQDLNLSSVELPLLADVDRPDDFFRLQKAMPNLTLGII